MHLFIISAHKALGPRGHTIAVDGTTQITSEILGGKTGDKGERRQIIRIAIGVTSRKNNLLLFSGGLERFGVFDVVAVTLTLIFMPRHEISIAGPDPDSMDWLGNNAAFTCPLCNKVFIVSSAFHKKPRPCPKCKKSKAYVSGGRNTPGEDFSPTAWIEY